MNVRPGDRIRILAVGLEETRIRPGQEWVVEFVDADGRHVWPAGTTAALCWDLGDRWEKAA